MLTQNATRFVTRESPSRGYQRRGYQRRGGVRIGGRSDQRCLFGNPSMNRRGYTLLELILVLGILVALTGLAVPMALDTLDGHRLRASADRVRGAFAEAKNQAIRSGNEVAFYYQPGFRTFFVLEFNPLVPKPLPPVPDEEAALNATSDIRANILEMGVVFAGADVSPDSRSQVSQVTDVPNYQRILFYPDGTAQPARVFMANQTGAGIRVELRALTGTSIGSEILNVEDFQ